MFYADVCAAVSAVTNRLRCVTVSRLGQLVLVGLLMGYQSVRADDATLTAEPDSIVLEDCTAGVERHDTVENEEMKRLTLAFVSMMPIYLAQSSDVMTAIRDERGLRDV